MNERILDHVGIAVESLEPAIPFWTALVGGAASEVDLVESQRVAAVFVGSGPGRVELIAPTHPDSPLARFLARRGPGLHHLCYRVPDIREALRSARASGLEIIDPEPRIGAHGHLVAFLHPRSTGGVLIEFLQPVEVFEPERDNP